MSKSATLPTPPATGREVGLRHFAMSVLPLTLFVTAAIGYDQLGRLGLGSTGQGKSAAARVVAGTAPAAAQPRHEPPAAPTASAIVAVDPASLLRDGRSLLDITHAETAGSVLAQGKPAHDMAARALELVLGGGEPLPLGIAAGLQPQPGAYAIVRGLPRNARLTHGISVGDASWLVDGADLARVALDMPAGEPGSVALDVTMLTGESRMLSRERITLSVKAAAVVAATPATAPATPSVGVAKVIERSSAEAAALSFRVARDTELLAGRGNLLRFELGPDGVVPEGAFIVVRGLPTEAALSRGVPMGDDAWLLSVAELVDLEVRVPAKVSGSIELDARLVSADGRLLAADQFRLPALVAAVSRARRSGEETAPVAASSVSAAPVRASPVTADIATAAIPAPSRTAAPAPAPVQRTETPTPVNVALARGKRMLAMGNIAVARPLLERAAVEGSGDAAALLAASFDPAWLRKAGVLGIEGDLARAARWYDEARRLGATDLDWITAAAIARR